MAMEFEYTRIGDELLMIKQRLSVLEANQRNAESGTTACSNRQDAALVEAYETLQKIRHEYRRMQEQPIICSYAMGRLDGYATALNILEEVKAKCGS